MVEVEFEEGDEMSQTDPNPKVTDIFKDGEWIQVQIDVGNASIVLAFQDGGFKRFKEAINRPVHDLNVLEMVLPAPDEAPICSCPHCGEEFNIETDDPNDHFKKLVEDDDELWLHKRCGGLVYVHPCNPSLLSWVQKGFETQRS